MSEEPDRREHEERGRATARPATCRADAEPRRARVDAEVVDDARTGADERSGGSGRRDLDALTAAQARARRVPRARPAHPGRLRELPQARRQGDARGARPRPRELARDLLPVLDNLERALAAGVDRRRRTPRATSEEVSVEGRAGARWCYDGAARQRSSGAGVEAFDPAGERFDPALARGALDPARRGRRSRAPCWRRSSAATGSTARCCGPARVVVSE